MNQEIKQNKISMIFEVIMFLMFVLVTILLFSKLNEDYYISKAGEENLLYSYEDKSDVTLQNKSYVKKIKEEYGINVNYGNDFDSMLERVNAIAQTDEFIINNNLKILYLALKKYPSDVFDITKSKKYPISIVLVSRFTNDNLALASRNSLNEVRIFVSNNSSFERAFHHEMYHALEYYMSDNKKYIFASWYSLNPPNFKYENNVSMLNNEYVYAKDLFSKKLKDGTVYEDSLKDDEKTDTLCVNDELYLENPYFVTKYSKASEKEDRAEIFAELMMQEKKEPYLQEGQHILKKAKLLTNTLEQNVSNNNFYYNKFLN